MLRQNGALTNYLFMNNRYTHFKSGESIIVLSPDLSNDRLNEILSSLDSSLVDNKQMVFVRRNLRIYQQDKIYIVKPCQRKYWTYSAACRDADEIFEDVSKAWR